MTVLEVKNNIRWGKTIYPGSREFVCPDGYKISVVNSDGTKSKEQLDKMLLDLVEQYLGQPLGV